MKNANEAIDYVKPEVEAFDMMLSSVLCGSDLEGNISGQNPDDPNYLG